MENPTSILMLLPKQNNEVCYFFRQFEQDRLMHKVVRSDKIIEEDLEGLCYEQTATNQFQIFGFNLDGIGFFNSVSILKTRFGSIVEMDSFNTSYFDNSGAYFNTIAKGRISGYYERPAEKYPVKCKRVKRLELNGKRIDGSILKCQLFGCKIMVSIQ